MPTPVDGIALNNFEHLLATIQHETPLGEFEHVISERDFPMCRYMWDKERRQIRNGTLIEHDIVFQPNGTISFVLPGEDCPVANAEMMMKVRQGWAISNRNMWFEEREINANAAGGGGAKAAARRIQDLYKSKRQQNIIMPTLTGWEAAYLDVPENADDNRAPHGIPAWISLGAVGFTGVDFVGDTITYGDGSTSKTIGGIATDDARTRGLWKNLVGTTPSWNSQQTIQVMWEVYKRGRFKKPPRATNVNANPFDSTVIFVGTETWLDLLALAESRMENKKNDLTASEGDLKFLGIPIIDVPGMDYQSGHALWGCRPMYWVNMRSFMSFTYEGEFLRESEPIRHSATKHRTYVIQCDNQANTMCINRRHQAVIHLPR